MQTDITAALPPGLKIANAYCTDANAARNSNPGSFGSFTDNRLTLPASNVKDGSVLACHVEIGFTQPRLTLQKTTTVGTGTFSFKGTANANGFSTSGDYAITTVAAGTPVKGATVTLTTRNAMTEVQEALSTGWKLSSAGCVDNNYAITNNSDTFGTLINSTTLQIPGTKVNPGADLLCTFTNAPSQATLTVRQMVLSPVPPNIQPPYSQTYSGSNGWGQRTLTNPALNRAVASPTLPLTALNTPTQVSTTLPDARWFVASHTCRDTAAASSGNPPGVLVSSSSPSITMAAAHVVPGATLVCTLMLGRLTP